MNTSNERRVPRRYPAEDGGGLRPEDEGNVMAGIASAFIIMAMFAGLIIAIKLVVELLLS